MLQFHSLILLQDKSIHEQILSTGLWVGCTGTWAAGEAQRGGGLSLARLSHRTSTQTQDTSLKPREQREEVQVLWKHGKSRIASATGPGELP